MRYRCPQVGKTQSWSPPGTGLELAPAPSLPLELDPWEWALGDGENPGLDRSPSGMGSWGKPGAGAPGGTGPELRG